MLYKVISGGQTGADHAGVFVGALYGYKTGGWMPRGFKRFDGLKPEFKNLYGMQEHNSAKYPPRTFQNVKESDGTIRFAVNFNSYGELCTKKAIDKYKKHFIDVDIKNPIKPKEVANWIIKNNIQILNVAGNRENHSGLIFSFVVLYLKDVFEALKEIKNN